MTIKPGTAARRQKVKSAEVGLDVLKALARLAPGASLSVLAEAAAMPASKAHRYLKALIAGGFAEQDTVTGRYVLGPEALHIGLAALGRIDVAAAAATPLSVLNAELNHTCLLSIWGNRGASVVRVEEAAHAVTVVTRVGAILPLLVSASGLTFGAYLPEIKTAEILRQELAELPTDKIRQGRLKEARTRMADVRALGICIIRSLYFPGVDAIAAPVIGPSGVIAAVITVLGPATSIDLDLEGPAVRAVRAAAGSIGERIGHRAEPSGTDPIREERLV
jgi:DNA-binding IclR family transcriptional regulator